MNLNGIEVNKDQLWGLIKSSLNQEAQRNPGPVNEVLSAVTAAMTRADMDRHRQHRQELINLLRLED